MTPETLDAHRELAAGIMVPVSGFVGGPESSFRFTEEGWGRRHELSSMPARLSFRDGAEQPTQWLDW